MTILDQKNRIESRGNIMKFMKKINVIIIAAVLMCSAMMLGACGNETGNVDAGGEREYKVTVKDALGNPYTSGIVVQYLKDGAQVAMQVCDDKGVATKKLEAGDYTVALQFTDDAAGYHYVTEGLNLSADKTELEVVLAKAIMSEPTSIYIGEKGYDAFVVDNGCTYVELKTDERNYYLFTPSIAGTYEFSAVDGANVTLGYYGSPHYVQKMSAAEVVDGKFTVSVSASMIGTGNTGTTVIVVGVDSESATSCVLGINRIGDPEWSVADEPWHIYETTADLSKYTLPAGTNLAEFDLTASSYNLVLNEKDGFYHLNSADGPLVYVNLTEDNKYLASFKNILDRSGVSRYFYAADGTFEKKVSYSECLLEYISFADETTGVYPLTEDLKHIIQNRGEYVGWWDANSQQYLFVNENGNPISEINNEIAWLFMCCYAN